jgi:signal transduction histidine kinase
VAETRILVQRATIALGALVLAVGVLTPVLARMDSGVQLMVVDPGAPTAARVVVAYVEPFSPAEQHGVRAGLVATEVNGQELIALPRVDYPATDPSATPDPVTGEYPQPSPNYQPAAPVTRVSDTTELGAITAVPVMSLTAIEPATLEAYDPESAWTAFFTDDGRNSLLESLVDVVFGMGVLFVIAWWLTTGRAGRDFAALGLPLALASAAPFLLLPLTHLWSPAAGGAYAVLLPACMLPLGLALWDRIEGEQDRTLALAAIAVCGVGALVIGGSRELNDLLGSLAWQRGLAWGPTILTAGIVLVPGIVAAGPAFPGGPPRQRATAGREGLASGALLRSTELAIAGATPAVSLLVAPSGAGWLLLVWVAAIAAAGRFTVRPLARLASRAQLQRDLIVAATEAERARVAADIHDDALQELTLLVRRLDAAGDTEGADIARTVSDKLRAICGDLRLPILDDLGVGPALDWLVLRIERLAGGEVRLERSDGTRPPPDVELAFFRVAQEALANAVKHGKPPIVVRYRSTDGAASLSIDDAGAGIAPDAGDRAEREGHFGLLNMQQRAEGIGAILDVRRWPTGGTHVQLEWRAR